MGWGKKTAGAKPQPVQAAPEIARIGEGVGDNPEVIEVVREKPTDAAKAEMTWAQLKSRKGWVPETVAIILYEFVKDRGMFEDLVKFAKGRK